MEPFGTAAPSSPPGWQRFDSEGRLVSHIRLDSDFVGFGRVAEPALAPDGTLFMSTMMASGEMVFFAAATGATPGPFLWPNSGYNWARTNSVLPE